MRTECLNLHATTFLKMSINRWWKWKRFDACLFLVTYILDLPPWIKRLIKYLGEHCLFWEKFGRDPSSLWFFFDYDNNYQHTMTSLLFENILLRQHKTKDNIYNQIKDMFHNCELNEARNRAWFLKRWFALLWCIKDGSWHQTNNKWEH